MEQDEVYIDITPEDLLEITLGTPDDFLKIRETLTQWQQLQPQQLVSYYFK